MANVNPIDGVKYGFRVIGYAIGIFIAAGVISTAGFGLLDGGSPVIGGIIVFLGFLTFFAGFMRVQYKLIADGVKKGMRAAQQ